MTSVQLEQDVSTGDSSSSPTWTSYLTLSSRGQRVLVQASYMGIAAIVGTLLRIILALFLGKECQSPGSAGWLETESVFCVTRTGTTDPAAGGVIFADLPANLLGSFFMGLMQDCKSLGLAVHAPIAWLPPGHVFQGMTILHLAIKTGFCGSLTTFSSWNSEMVRMMVGPEATDDNGSQIFRALLGYIIGMETSLATYVFGRTVAYWLHKGTNPELGQEIIDAREKVKQGYVMNSSLPEFERKFLLGLSVDADVDLDSIGLSSLENWRISTKESRRLEHVACKELQSLETSILANGQPIVPVTEDVCHHYGWDINALRSYVSTKETELEIKWLTPAGVRDSSLQESLLFFQLPCALFSISLAVAIISTVLAVLPIENEHELSDRSTIYSLLLAPPGALLRWNLGAWYNGKLPSERYSWVPAGTLLANVLGSAISISMVAWEYRIQGSSGLRHIATLRAIKVGFCGCLTTVSTFVSEVHSMTLQHTFDRAYKYMTASLVGSALISLTLFSLIAYL